jgi:hypothetical protein
MEFEIERDCLKYIESLAHSEENSPTARVQPNTLKMWEPEIQGFVFICLKNLRKDTLTLTVVLKDAQNVKPAPPFANENKVVIKPNDIQSVRLKILAYPYTYSYGISS